MKCTDLLIQDHKIILRALVVLEQMAILVENHRPLEHDDVEVILRFLRSFADDHHQAKEESALFPELMRTCSLPEGPVRQMLFEHDQERSLVEGIEDALYTKKGAEFAQFAHRLIELIRNHIRKEDNILFDIVVKSISVEQDEKVVEEFGKFEIDPLLLSELRALELKYVRKVA